MKQKISAAGVCFLLFFLLRYPEEALASAREGMNLWLFTLLPTLLPFLILTSILIHTNMIEKILLPLKGFFRICFGLTPSGAYAFLTGLLCGYPMGAKTASDLFVHGRISKKEACYLLTFCSNPSPAFAGNYLVHICLGDRIPLRTVLCLLLASDLICMCFFRFLVFRGHTGSLPLKAPAKKETSSFRPGGILDVSIMNGFETITRIGGYILLFSLLAACISRFWLLPGWLREPFLCLLEITTGLSVLAGSSFSYKWKAFISIVSVAFGGVCIMMQTRSLSDKRLPLLPHFLGKSFHAAVTAILLLIFV